MGFSRVRALRGGVQRWRELGYAMAPLPPVVVSVAPALRTG
jgi:3-mercaptopyruvate sulfurtransferase SseA